MMNDKMNNPIKYLYLIPAGIVIFTILSVISSCSADDTSPGNTLPDGKYPMTFTTAVGELLVTRGTADNSKWAGGEKVAIQLGNDAASYGGIKKYTAATDGALTPASNADLLYWRNTTETVTAWYPYSETKPTSFTVQTNQNTADNYQTSDFLYTTGTHTYSSSGACALVFKHLPVKVVINLINGDQVTADEVANATVSIVNQPTTSGAITDNGTVAVATDGTESITPKVVSSDASANDYQKTIQALLVPQDIANKKFIKVTIGTNNDARDYYFTPAADAAALKASTQYTYNITVQKEGLAVVSTSGTWIDNEQNDSAPSTTFQISLSDFDGTSTPNYKIADASGELNKDNVTGVYTTNHNRITVSFSKDESGTKKIKNAFIEVTDGICKQYTRSYMMDEAGVCTCTYTFDIRSDVSLKAVMLSDPQAGDYYYDDGTWSSTLSSTKTCIGVIFKAGAGTNDDVSKYSGKAIGEEISGYVVALKDAIKQAAQWGTQLATGEASGATVISSDASNADYTGYYDTQTIYNSHSEEADWSNVYHAFSSILHYRSEAVAPPTSSDWYLPSVSQLVDVCSNSTVKTNLGTAGGALVNNYYWSSSEASNTNAWRVQVSNGTPYSIAKTTKYYIRTVLTF